MTIATAKNNPRNTYTATGGQTVFTIGFEFFATSDIKVFRNGTALTYNAAPSSVAQFSVEGVANASDSAYEFGSGGTITLGGGATADDSIVIVRDIVVERTTDFTPAASFDVTALNTQLDTLMAMMAEREESTSRSIRLPLSETTATFNMEIPAKADRLGKLLQFNSSTGNPEVTTFELSGITASSAELNILDGCTLSTSELNQFDGFTIADEDDMSSNSATKLSTQQSIKAYVDSQVASSDTLAELTDTNVTSPADASLLFYDTATSKWIDNVISGDATVADTGVLTIASGAVETAMIAADAITGAKIADDAIDSEHYTDGSIDTAHIGDLQVTTAKIAADAITGAKIADDAINSEHYTDASIDTAHIADGQVTTAKIAADAIDATKIADDAISEEHLDPSVISGLSDATIAGADHLMFFDATDSQLKKVDAAELGVGSALTDVVGDTSPQLGGNLDVNGQDIVSTSNADIDIIPDGTGDVNLGADTVQVGDNNANATITTQGTGDLTLNTNNGTNSGSIVIADGANNDISLTPNGTGDVIIDGLKYPQADGSANQVLKTDGSGQLSFTTPSSGKIKQITHATDATLYAISITNSTSDHAGTIAYTITPSSTSHKVMIHFTIPQVKHAQHAGLRVRLYRDIGGGGYAHVSGLDGTAASSRQGGLFGNYDTNGDGNRAATTITGTIVDSPNTTSQVSYKFYFGAGDGATTVYVNRTQNDTDASYTHRTRTHVTLVEFE